MLQMATHCGGVVCREAPVQWQGGVQALEPATGGSHACCGARGIHRPRAGLLHVPRVGPRPRPCGPAAVADANRGRSVPLCTAQGDGRRYAALLSWRARHTGLRGQPPRCAPLRWSSLQSTCMHRTAAAHTLATPCLQQHRLRYTLSPLQYILSPLPRPSLHLTLTAACAQQLTLGTTCACMHLHCPSQHASTALCP
jgi:hypothetical protein